MTDEERQNVEENVEEQTNEEVTEELVSIRERNGLNVGEIETVMARVTKVGEGTWDEIIVKGTTVGKLATKLGAKLSDLIINDQLMDSTKENVIIDKDMSVQIAVATMKGA